MAKGQTVNPDDLPRDDPKACAAFYRAQREADQWQPGFGESLLMLQSTDEQRDELIRLMTAVDADLGPAPDSLPDARRRDMKYLRAILGD